MMSGGVDSSVAAALLKESGEFEVVGAHMICWKEAVPGARGCSAEEDAEDARRVADALGIPFYVFDLTAEYKAAVFDYMVREYEAGRTPNPDVMCNSEIKFGVFLEKALALGADLVATGHYARRRELKTKNEKLKTFELLSATDQNKDQSYFLWKLGQKELARALFPIGDLLKPQVRELARKFNLPTAEKKDSQGLCFVGQTDFAALLREQLPIKKGKVVTVSGEVVGEHDGTHFYTVGQRHGIGVFGGGQTYFVAKKDAAKNELIVAEGEDDPLLYSSEISASGVHWISGEAPASDVSFSARIRYRQPLTLCSVSQKEGMAGQIKASFKAPVRGAAAGQSIVFYEGDKLLGGATID